MKLRATREYLIWGVFITCSPTGHISLKAHREHQPIMMRRPAQCWRPHLSGKRPKELLRLVMCKQGVQPSTGCYYAGIPRAEQFQQIDLSCHRFPPQQVSASSRNSNAISQGKKPLSLQSPGLENGALPSMDALVEPLGAAKLRSQQRQVMEGNGSSLLPCIAVGLSCQEKKIKTIPQRGNSGTASARPMGLPTQLFFVVLLCKHALHVWPVFPSKECGP